MIIKFFELRENGFRRLGLNWSWRSQANVLICPSRFEVSFVNKFKRLNSSSISLEHLLANKSSASVQLYWDAKAGLIQTLASRMLPIRY